MRRAGVATFIVLVASSLAYWIYAIGQGPDVAWSPLFDGVLYNAALTGGAAVCMARAVRHGERLPWLLLGSGLAIWAAGDILFSITYRETDVVPFPTVSDVLYLLAYPAMAAGLVVLARRRLPRPRLVVWIGGVVVTLCITALTLAIMSAPLAAAWDEDVVATVVLLGLPIGNAILLGLVGDALALSGGVPPRGITFLACGLSAVAIADLASV